MERLRAELDREDHALLILRIDREMTWDEISTVLSGSGEPVTAATLRKRFERLKDRIAQRVRRTRLAADERGDAGDRLRDRDPSPGRTTEARAQRT